MYSNYFNKVIIKLFITIAKKSKTISVMELELLSWVKLWSEPY
jgi:hypothetical protein